MKTLNRNNFWSLTLTKGSHLTVTKTLRLTWTTPTVVTMGTLLLQHDQLYIQYECILGEDMQNANQMMIATQATVRS